MQILVIKTLLQSYINKHDIALWPNNAHDNFYEILDHAEDNEEEEIIELLDMLRINGWEFILENKQRRIG